MPASVIVGPMGGTVSTAMVLGPHRAVAPPLRSRYRETRHACGERASPPGMKGTRRIVAKQSSDTDVTGPSLAGLDPGQKMQESRPTTVAHRNCGRQWGLVPGPVLIVVGLMHANRKCLG